MNFIPSALVERVDVLTGGASSEYGADSAAPEETAAPTPNSHYAVTKNAAASLVYFSGRHRGLRCANLRLYSVYGPLEDRSRLIPTLVAEAHDHRLPPVSRHHVHERA